MNEIHDEAYIEACQEIEKLQFENSDLKEEMQMHKMDASIK